MTVGLRGRFPTCTGNPFLGPLIIAVLQFWRTGWSNWWTTHPASSARYFTKLRVIRKTKDWSPPIRSHPWKTFTGFKLRHQLKNELTNIRTYFYQHTFHRRMLQTGGLYEIEERPRRLPTTCVTGQSRFQSLADETITENCYGVSIHFGPWSPKVGSLQRQSVGFSFPKTPPHPAFHSVNQHLAISFR